MMIDEKSKDSDNKKNKFGEKFNGDEAKNDKQSTKRLKLLLDEDMELQELVVDLCEDSSEGTLEKILGEL